MEAIKALVVLAVIIGAVVGVLWYLRSRVVIVGEFVQFLIERKLWWITPIVIFMLLIGIAVFLTQSSPVAAGIIYTLF